MEFYKLCDCLLGHSSDVRCVVAGITPVGSLITSSRDQLSMVWVDKENENGHMVCDTVMTGHTGFAVCACVTPPLKPFGQLILTAGSDGKILVYKAGTSNPLKLLEGHTSCVTSLAVGNRGEIVSGSWDKTCRVWTDFTCTTVFQGHSEAVWAVAIVSGRNILSASADKTIHYWNPEGNILCSYYAHEDAVRGILVFSSQQFLSCSNDTTLRRWHIGGTCLATLHGHSSYVYDMAMLPNGCDFISCGEDRTVRVWRNDCISQTIPFPCQTIWSVACLFNGDIAAACSNAVCYVFTSSDERCLDEDRQTSFATEIAASQRSASEFDAFALRNTVNKGFLDVPGEFDGQQIFVSDGDRVVSYMWSQWKIEWQNTGVVQMSSAATSSGHTEVDIIFTVVFRTGRPGIRFGLNWSENIKKAVDTFVSTNNVPRVCIKRIMGFVEEKIGCGVPGEFSLDLTRSPVDLSCGLYPQYFPQQECIAFLAGNIDGMRKMLSEHIASISHTKRLSSSSLDRLVEIAGTDSDLLPEDLVQEFLGYLQTSSSIPFSALDLLRLVLRKESTCDVVLASSSWNIDILLRYLTSSCNRKCCLVVYRILSNLCLHQSGIDLLAANFFQLSESILESFVSGEVNIEVAIATLLLNLSVLVCTHGMSLSLEDEAQLMSLVSSSLPLMSSEEALFRVLVALGTLAEARPNLKHLAKVIGADVFISHVISVVVVDKVCACAAQLKTHFESLG